MFRLFSFLRFRLIVLFAILFVYMGHSQVHLDKIGKYNYEPLKMQFYEKDSSAPAVILSDRGCTYFEGDSELEGIMMFYERHTRIKIFNKSAYHLANFQIPLFSNGRHYENVQEIKACTYNLEGNEVVKSVLDRDNIYTENYSDNVKIKKFTMPNVKEGCVIEVYYRLKSSFNVSLREWEFQSEVPTMESTYQVRFIPFYRYRYALQGVKDLDYVGAYQDKSRKTFYTAQYYDMVNIFGLKDIPAFTDETFISSREDYIKKISFQLTTIVGFGNTREDYMKDWPTLANKMIEYQDFGKWLKTAERKMKPICKTFDLSNKTDIEILNALVRFAKLNFSWTGYYSKFTKQDVSSFLKSGSGNPAEINLCLTALMRQAGFDANPVMISTRNHGKIKKEFPFHRFFNYVIVHVQLNGMNYFFDATCQNCLPYQLPIRALNGLGFVVKKDSDLLIGISSKNTYNENKINLVIDLNNSADSAIAVVSEKYSGYELLNLKKTLDNNLNDYEQKISAQGNMHISNFSSEKVDSLNSCSFNYKASVKTGGNKKIILIHPFLHFPPSKSPFVAETREYPIDMVYPVTKSFHSTINVPEGYKINYLPENKIIDSTGYKLLYFCEVKDNDQIVISGLYSFKNPVYPEQEYANLKSFYNELVNALNKRLILEPIVE